MINRDPKEVIKLIAFMWRNSKEAAERETLSPEQKQVVLERMLTARYCLEYCGLTLNEIIELGSGDFDTQLNFLFSKNNLL